MKTVLQGMACWCALALVPVSLASAKDLTFRNADGSSTMQTVSYEADAPAQAQAQAPASGGGCSNNGCCQDSCGCGCEERIFGLFAPSDHCFDDFISPMTNPVYFEDPRTLTEARAIFINHKVPGNVGGGNVDLFALQVRAALTDKLSFIATKDGYMTSNNALVRDGWANVDFGLKLNLYVDSCQQEILSAGVLYEMPCGSTQSLQGIGGGNFDIFITGGLEYNCWHWISTYGVIVPESVQQQTEFTYWSNHFDRRLGCSNVYFLTEFNWYHYVTNGGNRATAGVMGGDLFNLGSAGIAGTDFVTGAIGLKVKPNCHTEIGVAWEVPLTSNHDLMDNRLTADLILRY